MVSHNDDFKETNQEIGMAMDLITAKGYTNFVGYCHSTGACYLAAYLMYSEKKDSQFSGFVLNSPFLD